MNKKLIALAVAAAFAAPAAIADVIVYGKVHMDIRATDTDNTQDNWTVNDNASRLGFKGSEDLGNGLKAIWKYEMTYDVDEGDAVTNARNSYLGLMGDFGTFMVGRHDTPAKMAYYAAGNDHLGDSILDFNRVGFTETRADDAIAYVSQNWDGFKFGVAIVPGEEAGTGTTQNDGFADSFSLGLMYAGNGFKAGAGYESLAASGSDSTSEMWQLGASYTFNNVTVGGQYQDLSDGTVGMGTGTTSTNNQLVSSSTVNIADGTDSNTWGVSAKVKFGDNNAVIANYGQLENDFNGTEQEVTSFGIGLQHTMSKRTSVYVAYDNQDNDTANTDNGTDRFAVGMIHNF